MSERGVGWWGVGVKLRGYDSIISTFWQIDGSHFYDDSVSTYLLRKQAAAAEGGNRREEAERKERAQRMERKKGDKQKERETEGEEEKEIILVTQRSQASPCKTDFLNCCDARKGVSCHAVRVCMPQRDGSGEGREPANLRDKRAGSS